VHTTKQEVVAVAQVEEAIKELSELELATVGGGVGDVILG
jgi:hypothetical protein